MFVLCESRCMVKLGHCRLDLVGQLFVASRALPRSGLLALIAVLITGCAAVTPTAEGRASPASSDET